MVSNLPTGNNEPSSNRLTDDLVSDGLASDQMVSERPSIEAVDRLADELATEYNNPRFRAWYCKLINMFGLERVRYWQARAKTGSNPAGLFNYYARQAMEGRMDRLPSMQRPDPDMAKIQVIPKDDPEAVDIRQGVDDLGW